MRSKLKSKQASRKDAKDAQRRKESLTLEISLRLRVPLASLRETFFTFDFLILTYSQPEYLNQFSMPKYLIEREWPGDGLRSQDELRNMALQSCEVLSNMQTKVHWVHSYVTDTKLYCVYIAPDEDALLEHASFGGFSAKKISVIKQIIDPVTAE